MPTFIIEWDEHKRYVDEFVNKEAARAWWSDADTGKRNNYDDVDFENLSIVEEKKKS